MFCSEWREPNHLLFFKTDSNFTQKFEKLQIKCLFSVKHGSYIKFTILLIALNREQKEREKQQKLEQEKEEKRRRQQEEEKKRREEEEKRRKAEKEKADKEKAAKKVKVQF